MPGTRSSPPSFPRKGTKMALVDRPLSPHLQVYRFIFTMMLSGLHRITGVGLAVGAALLVYWLIAIAAGPEAYSTAQALFGSWLGRLVLFGVTLALFYHLCTGVRHLLWDTGWGYDVKTANATGVVAVVVAVGLTLITWIVAYAMRGGS